VGGKLIYEAIKGEEELEIKEDFFKIKNILFLGFITSLDALAIGFSFALLNVESPWFYKSILIPNIVISVVVAIMALVGVLAGGKLSEKFPDKMKIIAGIILILIGV
jgi:putative Mn2+ efflux pump MntP